MINGVIHVVRTGWRWQKMPSARVPATTIYNRFHRWSQRGVWQTLFAGLVEVTPSSSVQAVDSMTIRRNERLPAGSGAAAQALGRSHGCLGTRIPAVADARGRIVAFTITADQLGDARAAHGLLRSLPPAD